MANAVTASLTQVMGKTLAAHDLTLLSPAPHGRFSKTLFVGPVLGVEPAEPASGCDGMSQACTRQGLLAACLVYRQIPFNANSLGLMSPGV